MGETIKDLKEQENHLLERQGYRNCYPQSVPLFFGITGNECSLDKKLAFTKQNPEEGFHFSSGHDDPLEEKCRMQLYCI